MFHIVERLPIICVALVLYLFNHQMLIIINLVLIIYLKSFDGSRIHKCLLKTCPSWRVPYFAKIWLGVKDFLLELAQITEMYEALLVLFQLFLLHLNLQLQFNVKLSNFISLQFQLEV